MTVANRIGVMDGGQLAQVAKHRLKSTSRPALALGLRIFSATSI